MRRCDTFGDKMRCPPTLGEPGALSAIMTMVPRIRRAILKVWRYGDPRRPISVMALQTNERVESLRLPGVCASATRSARRVQLSGGTHAESNLDVLTMLTGAVSGADYNGCGDRPDAQKRRVRRVDGGYLSVSVIQRRDGALSRGGWLACLMQCPRYHATRRETPEHGSTSRVSGVAGREVETAAHTIAAQVLGTVTLR